MCSIHYTTIHFVLLTNVQLRGFNWKAYVMKSSNVFLEFCNRNMMKAVYLMNICISYDWAIPRKLFSPNEATDLNISSWFSVLLIIFNQKIMRPVQNSSKNQCYIFHMTQRTDYFEPKALEFCVSAILVSYSWIVLKNTSMRLKRYCWQSELWICCINFHSNMKYYPCFSISAAWAQRCLCFS